MVTVTVTVFRNTSGNKHVIPRYAIIQYIDFSSYINIGLWRSRVTRFRVDITPARWYVHFPSYITLCFASCSWPTLPIIGTSRGISPEGRSCQNLNVSYGGKPKTIPISDDCEIPCATL